jgi:dTDP-glucose 4,6-dehydratase
MWELWMPKTLLVTGGAGFIGSNFVRRVLALRQDWRVLNFDLLTYAGSLTNLVGLESNPRHHFVRGDIADASAVDALLTAEPVDAIVNFAAESHVDRSIEEPGIFVRTNVMGTQVLLEAALRHKVRRFLQVSTDEVYGSLGPEGLFREDTPLDPSSPYSASKAAADLLVSAYRRTHGLETVITRCSNNYGRHQFPEKLIPLMITRAQDDLPLPIYGDGLNVRDWIHVDDHNDAVLAVLERGAPGRLYNVGADAEWSNIDLVRKILRILGKPESLITFVKDRPGHDRRYAMDATRLRTELGWAPTHSREEGLRRTVQWYLDNEQWWRPKRARTG